MKGIILAGGTGSRLFPVTQAVSKQLLPVYNKPMVFYPLSTLMSAGIREILLITSPSEQPLFQRLLGDGSAFGIQLHYKTQLRPAGIAESLLIGEEFIAGGPCALILGDNLFFGAQLPSKLKNTADMQSGAVVFLHEVANPAQYGVAELDDCGHVTALVEKPKVPKSNFAVTGLYFYDATASTKAAKLLPSDRGELEITDLNNAYLREGNLKVEILGRGAAWLDTGNPADLLEASNFVRAIESRQGIMIGCPEEIGYQEGWLSSENILARASELGLTDYAYYLIQLVHGRNGGSNSV